MFWRPLPRVQVLIGLVAVAALSTGCATDASRARTAATDFLAACRRSDREAAGALLRRIRADEPQSLPDDLPAAVEGVEDVIGVHVSGNWAVVGLRKRVEGFPASLPVLLHEEDGAWRVVAFWFHWKEVELITHKFPDAPPDYTFFRPMRDFNSKCWRDDEQIPTLEVGSPREVVVQADTPAAKVRWKFSADDDRLARIRVESDEGMTPRLGLVSPEGGSRWSHHRASTKEREFFSQSDLAAEIRRPVGNGTYIVLLAPTKPGRVRLSLDLAPLPPREKPSKSEPVPEEPARSADSAPAGQGSVPPRVIEEQRALEERLRRERDE